MSSLSILSRLDVAMILLPDKPSIEQLPRLVVGEDKIEVPHDLGNDFGHLEQADVLANACASAGAELLKLVRYRVDGEGLENSPRTMRQAELQNSSTQCPGNALGGTHGRLSQIHLDSGAEPMRKDRLQSMIMVMSELQASQSVILQYSHLPGTTSHSAQPLPLEQPWEGCTQQLDADATSLR